MENQIVIYHLFLVGNVRLFSTVLLITKLVWTKRLFCFVYEIGRTSKCSERMAARHSTSFKTTNQFLYSVNQLILKDALWIYLKIACGGAAYSRIRVIQISESGRIDPNLHIASRMNNAYVIQITIEYQLQACLEIHQKPPIVWNS